MAKATLIEFSTTSMIEASLGIPAAESLDSTLVILLTYEIIFCCGPEGTAIALRVILTPYSAVLSRHCYDVSSYGGCDHAE